MEFPWGLTSADVIGDYLSAVCKHVIATLHRRVDKEIMQRAAIDFALTVPAIWSDAARKKTQDAAIMDVFTSSWVMVMVGIFSLPRVVTVTVTVLSIMFGWGLSGTLGAARFSKSAFGTNRGSLNSAGAIGKRPTRAGSLHACSLPEQYICPRVGPSGQRWTKESSPVLIF